MMKGMVMRPPLRLVSGCEVLLCWESTVSASPEASSTSLSILMGIISLLHFPMQRCKEGRKENTEREYNKVLSSSSSSSDHDADDWIGLDRVVV